AQLGLALGAAVLAACFGHQAAGAGRGGQGAVLRRGCDPGHQRGQRVGVGLCVLAVGIGRGLGQRHGVAGGVERRAIAHQGQQLREQIGRRLALRRARTLLRGGRVLGAAGGGRGGGGGAHGAKVWNWLSAAARRRCAFCAISSVCFCSRRIRRCCRASCWRAAYWRSVASSRSAPCTAPWAASICCCFWASTPVWKSIAWWILAMNWRWCISQAGSTPL